MKWQAFLAAALASVLMTCVAQADVRIVSDPGGEVASYVQKFRQIRDSGQRVVVDEPCLSACTVLTGIVPRDRVCITHRAGLGFHAASYYDDAPRTAVPTRQGSELVTRLYPPEIRSCLSTASAKSPREIGNETRTTLDAGISKAVLWDMASKDPADDDLNSSKLDQPSYLADYAYSEVPPDKKPADTVLDSLKDIPIGTPQEEIKRAAEAFGVNVTFMEAIAKIESDFDPKQKTGSYVGLFQLSKDEFAKYGSGDILNVRDNAIAAAYKFATEAIVYQLRTHKEASFVDVYMIHQQGTEGAEEHLDHPDRLAWESMCATDEGKAKGEKWCKRAIWDNTLPATKKLAKSVDNLTSEEFVNMWRDQVDHVYAQYSLLAE